MPGGNTLRLVGWSIVVYALYLGAGNLLLNSSIVVDLANRKPERFTAAWRYAWTLYPGHVHATGLEMRGRVRSLAWQIEADVVDGRIALLPLFGREIHLPHLQIVGVDASVQRSDLEVAAAKARPGGWLLRLDRAAARDVRSLAFDGMVLAGSGNAEISAIKLLRGGPIEILPSRASFDAATLQHLDTPLAHDLSLDLRLAVERHLGREFPGLRKLEKSNFEISVQGRTVGLAIESDPGSKSLLRNTEESGGIEGQIGWQHGRLMPGGALRVWAPIREALPGAAPTTARARATLEITDDSVQLHADLGSSSLAELRGAADLRVEGRAIPVDDPTALLRRTSGRMIARWHFASLAWLGNLLPPTHFVRFDGSGQVAADLEIADGVIRAGSHLDIPSVDITAHVMGNWFEGDASAKLRFRDSSAGTPRLRVDAVLKEFQIAADDERQTPYVRGRDLRIEAIEDGSALVELAGPGADTPPPEITLDHLTEDLDARLRFENATVPDLSVYNRYLPRTDLQIEAGTGALSGNLHFDGSGNVADGAFMVTGDAVDIAIAGLRLQADLASTIRMKRADMETLTFDASGSRIELRDVRVLHEGPAATPDWWSTIDFDRARLDWGRPLAFDGQLRLRMKNVGPLLDIYAERKDLPNWIEPIIEAGEVSAQGGLQWRGDVLVVEPLQASNERFEVAARLRMQEKRLAGDLFARWGAIGLGVQLDGAERKLHLTGAREWFDSRAAPIAP